MARYIRLSAFLAIVGCAGIALAQPQYYDPQAQPKHSTMFGVGWEPITDNEFAGMVTGLLVNGGASNARSATILMEQCFSGGMLGEIATGLGAKVRWVGGTAAAHYESSWGEPDSDPYAEDYWAHALHIALQENDTMINTVNLARTLDPAGPLQGGSEHPQSIYRNGGESINIRTIGASFHNAIIWAGHANGERHVHDVQVMYQTLQSIFSATGDPYTITVLGDQNQLGLTATPATKANLQSAFNAVAFFQNPNADFVFFATDHGGTDTYWNIDPFVLTAHAAFDFRFDLTDAELAGLGRITDANNPSGLWMKFAGLDGFGVQVYLDDVLLADPFATRGRDGSSFLDVSVAEILRHGTGHTIHIVNDSNMDVTLLDGLFRTGGIDSIVGVPEPTILAALGCVSIVVALGRRRRRQ